MTWREKCSSCLFIKWKDSVQMLQPRLALQFRLCVYVHFFFLSLAWFHTLCCSLSLMLDCTLKDKQTLQTFFYPFFLCKETTALLLYSEDLSWLTIGVVPWRTLIGLNHCGIDVILSCKVTIMVCRWLTLMTELNLSLICTALLAWLYTLVFHSLFYLFYFLSFSPIKSTL